MGLRFAALVEALPHAEDYQFNVEHFVYDLIVADAYPASAGDGAAGEGDGLGGHPGGFLRGEVGA